MSIALALAASLLWGGSDFVGGTASRKLRAVQVLSVSQVLSALVLLLVLILVPLGTGGGGLAAWGSGWLGWSLVAGVTWALAMGALYTALARGTMGVVAPIASSGAVVPVVLGVVGGERPSTLQVVGVVVALVGIVASAGPDLRPDPARSETARSKTARSAAAGAVPLALLAAVLFGVEIYALSRGSDVSVPSTLLGMRLSAVVLVVIAALAVRRNSPPLTRTHLPPLLALGVLDLAATAAYALATQHGLVSVVAVLASLYPAVTVLLARQVHGERLSRVQVVGVLTVLAGAVASSLG